MHSPLGHILNAFGVTAQFKLIEGSCVMEQLVGGGEFLFEVGNTLAKGEVPRQFDKTDQVSAAPATVAVEQVFLRVDVERGLGFLMQGTQSHELGAGAGLMPSPMVLLQVLQQRNALFEPF